MHEFSTELKDQNPIRYSIFVDKGQVVGVLEHEDSKSLMYLRNEENSEISEKMFEEAARFLAMRSPSEFGNMKQLIVADHKFWKIAESVLYEILREYRRYL